MKFLFSCVVDETRAPGLQDVVRRYKEVCWLRVFLSKNIKKLLLQHNFFLIGNIVFKDL